MAARGGCLPVGRSRRHDGGGRPFVARGLLGHGRRHLPILANLLIAGPTIGRPALFPARDDGGIDAVATTEEVGKPLLLGS